MIAAGPTTSVGPALRTLLYLDMHLLWNRIKAAARNPLRLVLWLIFLAGMVSALQLRSMMDAAIKARPLPASGRGPEPVLLDPTHALHVAATFLPGVILVALGLFTIAACRQPLGTFRSAADARFLCGSALPPRLVVLWLILRAILAVSWRLPLMLIFFVIVLPTSLGVSGTTGLVTLTMFLLLTATMGLSTPIFISRQRRFGPNPAIAGWSLIVLGVASLVVVFVALSPGPPILPTALQPVAASLPPGSWLVGAFEGNAPALLALAVLATGSLTLTWMMAGDAFPELWQASARVIVIRRAMRRRGPFMTPSDQRRLLTEAGIAQPRHRQLTAAASSPGRWVPPGAWTILWKEWLATRRVAGGMRLPIILLAVAVVLGAAIGFLSRWSPGLAGALVGPLSYVVVMGSFFTAIRMSGDLRKPIWWLSASRLRARLGVMLAARSLRLVIPIAAGLVTASMVGGRYAFVVVGVPIAVAAIWAINAIGLGTYAIIPGSADMRGPGAFLRMVAFVALLIPIGIAAIAGGITAGGIGSLAAAVATALAEGWLLVLFAASQLDGNGLAYAQAERR